MTNVSTGALKGRYMQEVYEVVCRHSKGVLASDVKRECPTIPSGRVGATLRKLKDLGLVRAEYDNTSTVIRRWVKNRGGEEKASRRGGAEAHRSRGPEEARGGAGKTAQKGESSYRQ